MCWARQIFPEVPPIFPYLSFWMSFSVFGPMCIIQPFCSCPMSYHWLNTHTSPFLTPHHTSGSGLLSAHFPTLSDLPILPLFHLIFSCSSQYFNATMDVHRAQFTSWAFSIMSLVNSLPASQHVFVEAGPWLSVCVHPAYALTQSAQAHNKLHPFASVCNTLHCVKTHRYICNPCTHTEIRRCTVSNRGLENMVP